MSGRFGSFQYADAKIGEVELQITISSMILGVGILVLPRAIAKTTQSSDGWISIAIATAAALLTAWLLGRLAARYPGRRFFDYASEIVSKPIAWVIVSVIIVYFLLLLAYEIRSVAAVSREYLFDRTPFEVVALSFLLLTIYAAAGTRIGVIRLNLLFYPLVIVIVVAVLLLNLQHLKLSHMKPVFVTPWKGLLSGAKECVFSIFGFELLLFYAHLLKRPDKAPRAAMLGVLFPALLYMAIYLFVIALFSKEVTENLVYPTVELAKETTLPGEFFERFESIFFTIWLMTIFNSALMALDISLMLLQTIVSKFSKMFWAGIVCPIIYIVSMLPENLEELARLGTVVSYTGLAGAVVLPLLLYGISLIRGRKTS